MIYLKPYLTLPNLLIFVYLFVILIFFILKEKEYKHPKPKNYDIPEKYIIFINKYYLSNKYYAIFCVICYISAHFLILFLFRYYLIGTSNPINVMHNTVVSLDFIIIISSTIIMFLVAIILFYYLLNLIFFDEILKLYLYCCNNNILFKIKYNITTIYFKDFIGPLYLFIDNIAKLNINLDEEHYDIHYNYIQIYENFTIKNLNMICILYCKKIKLLHILFIFINKILRILYIHLTLQTFTLIIITYLTFFCLFIDIFMFQRYHYVYYAIVFVSVYRLLYNVLTFIEKKDSMFDTILYNYFYTTEILYRQQRLFKENNYDLLSNNAEIINALSSNDCSNDTFKSYILNNLNNNYGEDHVEKNIKWMYIRFSVYIILLTINIYFFTQLSKYFIFIGSVKITNIVIIVPIIMLYFLHINTFKQNKNAEIHQFVTYIYNRKFGILFWVSALIYAYIYWILLFKMKFLLLPDDILLKNDYLTILYEYTLEEKKQIFDIYFDYYKELYGFTGYYLELLDGYKDSINLKEFYCDMFTIHDISFHLDQLLQNYSDYIKIYLESLIREENAILQLQNKKNIITYFAHGVTIFVITCHIIPSLLLTHVFKNQFKEYAQDFLKKRMIIDMGTLEFHDFTQSFMDWLLKKEAPMTILREILKYFLY